MNFTEILYIQRNSKNNINFDSKALIMVMAEILTIARILLDKTMDDKLMHILNNNSSVDQSLSSYNFGGLWVS